MKKEKNTYLNENNKNNYKTKKFRFIKKKWKRRLRK